MYHNIGRRMSRSASCMSDLIRQELSDYIDHKSEQLPSLSTSNLFEKQKLSYSIDGGCKSKSEDSIPTTSLRSKIAEAPRDTANSLGSQQPPHFDSTKSPSLITVDSKISPVTFNTPSPPLLPKPPSSSRCSHLIIRRPRSAAKMLPECN